MSGVLLGVGWLYVRTTVEFDATGNGGEIAKNIDYKLEQ